MSQILLVDDSADLLNVLNWSLRKKGYSCATAYYRAGIFHKLSKSTTSLIILDINLNDDDGREICMAIKLNPETKDIPVILCSANHELLHTYKNFLADDFIEKPFGIDTIVKKIEQLMSTKTLTTSLSS